MTEEMQPIEERRTAYETDPELRHQAIIDLIKNLRKWRDESKSGQHKYEGFDAVPVEAFLTRDQFDSKNWPLIDELIESATPSIEDLKKTQAIPFKTLGYELRMDSIELLLEALEEEKIALTEELKERLRQLHEPLEAIVQDLQSPDFPNERRSDFLSVIEGGYGGVVRRFQRQTYRYEKLKSRLDEIYASTQHEAEKLE